MATPPRWTRQQATGGRSPHSRPSLFRTGMPGERLSTTVETSSPPISESNNPASPGLSLTAALQKSFRALQKTDGTDCPFMHGSFLVARKVCYPSNAVCGRVWWRPHCCTTFGFLQSSVVKQWPVEAPGRPVPPELCTRTTAIAEAGNFRA
ncbi:hypothetical protein N657DRAFT_180100 [Parathielavia appendiculata]|uniref:Uncharacterized protein n=1 Tax=Parathielavia appendiculata TaxID=2587402 RepID=A0AAN6Z6I6_9PEZI|nr:hypothetical protein N657DRAFT_180100 [Parathielavia appendiculata]